MQNSSTWKKQVVIKFFIHIHFKWRGTQDWKFNFVKIYFRLCINGSTQERKINFVKIFPLSLGIEPRIFIPWVPQLYHSSTIAQFNIGICCIYSMTGQVKFLSMVHFWEILFPYHIFSPTSTFLRNYVPLT